MNNKKKIFYETKNFLENNFYEKSHEMPLNLFPLRMLQSS